MAVKALTLPAMPLMNPAISAVMPRPSKPGSQVAHHHQRQHFVIAVQPCAGVSRDDVFADQMHQAAIGVGENNQSQQAGKNHDERNGHLEKGTDYRGHARGTQELAASTRCTTRKSVVQ